MSVTEMPAIGRTVSSLTLCAPGTVLTGASFTALTVIAIASVSVAVPSLVATVSVSAPLKLRLPGIGEARQRRVDLRCRAGDGHAGAAVAGDAAPPAVTLSVPLVTLSVVVSALLSTSATETPAIGRAVSSATLCAPGTVLTGASFTGLTVIATVSVSVAVPSLVATVSVSAPLKLGLPV